MDKTCPRCGSRMTMGAPHVDGPVVQWECHGCGKVVIEHANPSEHS